MRQLLTENKLTGTYGGIKIESDAHSGSLDTVHILFDNKGGFSANLKMFDRDPHAQNEERDFFHTKIWTLRAPMLALQSPDPALMFPSGTVLRPKVFVRNTTSHPVSANFQFNWKSESTTGKASGPALMLAPFETRLVDVTSGSGSGSIGLPAEAHWAAVIITTPSHPDDLMAVAASYDESLKYGAQTPFSDQISFRWEDGKWESDKNHDSIITVGNAGQNVTKTAFTIFYDKGRSSYRLESTLQPDEQMWVDVGDLIRRQVPDVSGKTLPSTLTSGSYEFADLTNHAIGSLFEGKVIYDRTNGHVSYGCASCCSYLGAPWVTLAQQGVLINSTAQIDLLANDGCDGYQSSVLDGFTSWTVGDTTVATISAATALLSGVGEGSTSEQSPGDLIEGGSDIKRCRVIHYTPTGSAGVGLSIGVSSFQYGSTSGGICSYPLSCPNGNANASCQAGTFYLAPPCTYDYISNTYIVVRKGTTKSCYGFGQGVQSNTPKNCS